MPDRAEIEAVARAIYGLAPNAPIDTLLLDSAAAGIEALDRVRDARGDDAAPQLHAGTGSDRIFMHSTHQRAMAGCRLCEAEAARSPQGEDHEAGKVWFVQKKHLRPDRPGSPMNDWVRVSPSRDGTVAVEDVERLRVALEWTVTRYEETLAGRSVRDADECLLHSRGLLAEFGSARAGESNEGGNQ